jgi:plasmid stabilization system protein ParE
VARLRFSSAAKDDIDSIAEYIAEMSGSRSIATRFAEELRGKCRDLARAPIQMGRLRPELRRDLRSHPHKNYIIFFRYVTGGILEIVNILEGHRDIAEFYRRQRGSPKD